jgi:hypothetical protein
MGNDEFLGIHELAARWKVRPKVIYAMRYRRAGPRAMRVGRELRFSLADVERWEESRRDDGGSKP